MSDKAKMRLSLIGFALVVLLLGVLIGSLFGPSTEDVEQMIEDKRGPGITSGGRNPLGR